MDLDKYDKYLDKLDKYEDLRKKNRSWKKGMGLDASLLEITREEKEI